MNFGTNCFSHMNRTPGGVFFVIIMPREITFSIKLDEKHKLSLEETERKGGWDYKGQINSGKTNKNKNKIKYKIMELMMFNIWRSWLWFWFWFWFWLWSWVRVIRLWSSGQRVWPHLMNDTCKSQENRCVGE